MRGKIIAAIAKAFKRGADAGCRYCRIFSRVLSRSEGRYSIVWIALYESLLLVFLGDEDLCLRFKRFGLLSIAAEFTPLLVFQVSSPAL